MKNIEDYWFACVTDERLEKESLADLLRVLEQHLPYLLDGIINSQDEHVRVTSKTDYNEKVGFFCQFSCSIIHRVNSKVINYFINLYVEM
jgi:hypothetical protein